MHAPPAALVRASPWPSLTGEHAASAQYSFRTVWQVPHNPDRVWAALEAPMSWPRWLPGCIMVERPPQEPATPGQCYRFHWRGAPGNRAMARATLGLCRGSVVALWSYVFQGGSVTARGALAGDPAVRDTRWPHQLAGKRTLVVQADPRRALALGCRVAFATAVSAVLIDRWLLAHRLYGERVWLAALHGGHGCGAGGDGQVHAAASMSDWWFRRATSFGSACCRCCVSVDGPGAHTQS